MYMRHAGCEVVLADFMRTHLYSLFSSLGIGMKILLEDEGMADTSRI